MTGHLFYKRAALALMALFAALAMTLLPADGRKVSHAQTPSSMTLVSNTGQTLSSDRPVIGSSYDRAQEFTTGTNRDGYVLTSIDIMLNAAFGGATDLTMTLHSGSATGTKVADFDEPSSLTTGNATYTFIASAAVSLDASTSYWIVLEEPTTHRGGLVVTASDNQDTDSAAGWLIADAYEFRTASATGSFTVTTTGKSAIIDVKGYVGSIPTLVSNIEQGNDLVANVNTRRAQAFTTGFNLTGYTVTGVDIDYRDAEGHGFALSLCETNNDGTPNQSPQTCDIFTQPSFSAVGRLRFEAAASFTLDPATTYTVVFYSGSGDNVSLGGTSSIAEDASSLAGWSIRDKFHHQDSDSNWQIPGSVRSIRIDIEGTPKAPVANSPTSTDHTVETVEDTAHTFSAAHFNFMATASGDALSKVHILTLPDEGTLALSGTAVTAGDEISKTDIDAGNLKFTPDTGETGQGYASFDFRVEGSSLTSTNSYRMTIDVRTAESVPPALVATNAAVLAADGKTLTLTYNEPMKETSTPGNSAFTVEATPAGGSEAEVALATTDGVTVTGRHCGADAGQAHRAQRRLGQGDLRQAGQRRCDRGRQR